MVNLRLVCLLANNKKNGTGMWYRATFKKHTADGKPTTAELFLDEKVGSEAVAAGLIEDVDVTVELDFDDFFRPAIKSMKRATNAKPNQMSLGELKA